MSFRVQAVCGKSVLGGTGKRGGGRTIYYALASDGIVYLLAAFAKVDKSDLTATEKRLLKALVKDLTDD